MAINTPGLVPAGAFVRGCDMQMMMCEADGRDEPQLTIMLSAFTLDLTEVTQAAYNECMIASACTPPSQDFDPVILANHPVVWVDWSQAVAYCAFRGQRLPTEAEWEKAARGIDARIHPWGNAAPSCAYANMSGCGGQTSPVGSSPMGAGPYGHVDMIGNVWEWVADWYDPAYYASSPATDPTGPATGSLRALRGGYFGSAGGNILTYNRGNEDPLTGQVYTGFRCARSN